MLTYVHTVLFDTCSDDDLKNQFFPEDVPKNGVFSKRLYGKFLAFLGKTATMKSAWSVCYSQDSPPDLSLVQRASKAARVGGVYLPCFLTNSLN